MEPITDDEDFLELIDLIEPIRKKPKFKERKNYFEELDDKEFLNRFRLSKDFCRHVVSLISEDIKSPTNRNHALSPEEMFLLTLRYYATGTMMIVIGDFMGVDKSTACRAIHKVSVALAKLYSEYIKMPVSEEEKKAVATDFYMLSKFPLCIGALDCTHVKIQSPGGEDAEIFRNRKGYFSLNVQAVCDSSLNFLNLVCRWPGSSHDSTIFKQSALCASFENGEYGKYLLVGDSGYAIRKFLITPLGQPRSTPEHLFNESQIRTRNPIERCFGVWKRRFPILALGLKVDVRRCEAIVVSTAILHNLANKLRSPLPDVDEVVWQMIQSDLNFFNETLEMQSGRGSQYIINNSTRAMLIQNYFATL